MTPGEELQQAYNDARERGLRMAGQVGNWIITANAGGIAFVLTAARDSASDRAVSLAPVYALFLVGVVLGVVAKIFGVMSNAHIAHAAGQMVEQNRVTAKPATSLSTSRAWRILSVISIGLYAVAAVCAVCGLAFPLANGLL